MKEFQIQQVGWNYIKCLDCLEDGKGGVELYGYETFSSISVFSTLQTLYLGAEPLTSTLQINIWPRIGHFRS